MDTKKNKRSSGKTVQIDPDNEKEIIWWPEKLKEIIKQDWPIEMCKDGGFELGRVQQGFEPSNYREVPSIGVGVKEIKLQDKNKSQYRIIYLAKFKEAIYVFHVITKKTTEQTSIRDIQIAKKRFNEIIDYRRTKVNE